MPNVTHYHGPPVYFSQFARIVLAEKAVPWISKFIAAIARLQIFKLEPFQGRSAVGDGYARGKARPSFEKGDVWESFKFAELPPDLLQNPALRLAVILLVIGGHRATLWWLL